ncbi:MAG TPA: DUF2244 domain-containing protein, partial [Devosia sp.]|nr:DUF2244 domain-containing protein [Devosia sp.]
IVLATVPSLIFFALGAWPIVAFMLLTVAAIAGAMQLALRGEKRSEQLTLWADRLEIVVVDAKGVRTRSQFNPKALRLIVDRDFNERTTALWLRTIKGETQIGAFLSQDDKSSLAKAFGTALRRARGH